MSKAKYTASQSRIEYRLGGGNVTELQEAIVEILTERDKLGLAKVTWTANEDRSLTLGFDAEYKVVGGW